MIVGLSGHRSEGCETESIVRTKARVKLQYKEGLTFVITGMANGFDLWAADEALSLGLGVWCARPWKGHRPRKGDEELYDKILTAASRVVDITEHEEYPGPWCYAVRNHWIVDNCDLMMIYWSGKETGGTKEAREYAMSVKKPIANIYYDPPF